MSDNEPDSPPPPLDEFEEVLKKRKMALGNVGMEPKVQREKKILKNKRICICHGDITKENVDCITNAANCLLLHAGGVAKAIVRAGGIVIQNECLKYLQDHSLRRLETSQICFTSSGKLKMQGIKGVVHAVGPIWSSLKEKVKDIGKEEEDIFMKKTILNVLNKCNEKGYKSVSIPAISTGIFHFPKARCANIMIDTAIEYFKNENESSLSLVKFTNFDKQTVDIFCSVFDKIMFEKK